MDSEKTWTTSDGEEIPYSKLGDQHLLNIIKYVERKSQELDGQIIRGGGSGWDADDVWFETGNATEWLEHFDHDGLVKEATRRGLLVDSIKCSTCGSQRFCSCALKK